MRYPFDKGGGASVHRLGTQGRLRNFHLPAFFIAGLVVPMLVSPLLAKPVGHSDLNFICDLGHKRVEITTVKGRLVYRFGTRRHTELMITEEPDVPNIFYRYNILGTKGGGQQLRFVNGNYSYGISSWFIAGRNGAREGVAFFVLRSGKLLSWRTCRGDNWLTEDNQLRRLPPDSLRVGPEGVSTGKLPPMHF